MSTLAAHERTLLCATAQQVGPDAPTLCGGWDVRDLVIHLLIREGHPIAAAGIFVPPAAPLTRRTEDKLAREDFADLVRKLRHGPPLLSPFSIPRLGPLANVLEFYVHHEDIRRAQSDWTARSLPGSTENTLWGLMRRMGKATALKAPTGVTLERSDAAGTQQKVKSAPSGAGDVVVRGLPSELVLFAYGRQGHALVKLDGAPDDVAALRSASLGV